MIDKPWHCNTLHPGTDQGNALTTEKETIIPVLKRPEDYIDPGCIIQISYQWWITKFGIKLII